MLPAGDSRMEWTLCLVGMGIDGQSRSFEVMTISRPDGLGDIANLGLTLAEGKLLLAQVQQQLVAEQATTHAALRPDCRSCGRTCQVKDWRPHRIATLFGEVRLRLPRFLCTGCGCGETAVSWEHANPWGSLRGCCGCPSVIDGAETAITPAEGVLEPAVQHGGANVEEGLHRHPVPAHLLLLVHAPCHDFVDRTLHERG